MTTLLLELLVGEERYLVPRTHVAGIDLLRPGASPDVRAAAPIVRELAPLLGLPPPAPGRRRALTIALRRRAVVLLVDGVEGLEADTALLPLPPLLARRLSSPWVLGAVAGERPTLVLDLKRIAADIVLTAR